MEFLRTRLNQGKKPLFLFVEIRWVGIRPSTAFENKHLAIKRFVKTSPECDIEPTLGCSEKIIQECIMKDFLPPATPLSRWLRSIFLWLA
jgi:hypothetical protein